MDPGFYVQKGENPFLRLNGCYGERTQVLRYGGGCRSSSWGEGNHREEGQHLGGKGLFGLPAGSSGKIRVINWSIKTTCGMGGALCHFSLIETTEPSEGK